MLDFLFTPKSRTRATAAARRALAAGRKVWTRIQRVSNGWNPWTHDGIMLSIMRGDRIERKLRLGPNTVSAFITHADGSITDLGLSHNLLTNIGRDVWAQWIGGGIPAGGAGSPATATAAGSITATGTPWTASNLATPQLGLAGFRVYAPVTGLTTAPVYGNIYSNTTSVASIDQWWTATDTVGTTPASTNAFIIGAGGIGSVRFMALTADAAAAAATDTVLATEITTNNLGRALATYAHTFGASTMTLQKAFSPNGTQAGIVKMGLFCDGKQNSGGPLIFEATFATASVASGDTLTCTDTLALSG